MRLDSNHFVLKKQLRVIYGCIAIICAYLTGVIECMMSVRYTVTFFNALLAFFRYLDSIPIFLVLFGISGGIMTWLLSERWDEDRRRDKLGRGFLHAPEPELGDAHAAEPYEYEGVAQIRPIDECRGIIFGQLTEDGSRCIDFNPDFHKGEQQNNNACIIAMSGSGKTRSFAKTNILNIVGGKGRIGPRQSLIITDPDGGLYRDCAAYCMDHGYVVRTLNLKNCQLSDGWDCLAEIKKHIDDPDPQQLLDLTEVFADTVISNITDKLDVYSKASKSLLKAIILRVLLSEQLPRSKKNMKTVMSYLQIDAQDVGPVEALAPFFNITGMTEREQLCLQPFSAFKNASKNLSGNVVTELANGLGLLSNPGLCDMLSTPGIDLQLPGLKPCAYFLQFPDTNSTYSFLLALFFSLQIESLALLADMKYKNGLPVPVCCMYDELANLGTIRNLSKNLATCRKRNIYFLLIVQDIPQLENAYEHQWKTILGNCGTIASFGIGESVDTADYFSKRIGKTTIERRSVTHSATVGLLSSAGESVTTSIAERDFIASAELLRFGYARNILFFANSGTVVCNKTPYPLFPGHTEMHQIMPSEITSLFCRKQRAAYAIREGIYLKHYWETHTLSSPGDIYDNSDAIQVPRQRKNFVSMLADIIVEDGRYVHGLYSEMAENVKKGGWKNIFGEPEPKAEKKALLPAKMKLDGEETKEDVKKEICPDFAGDYLPWVHEGIIPKWMKLTEEDRTQLDQAKDLLSAEDNIARGVDYYNAQEVARQLAEQRRKKKEEEDALKAAANNTGYNCTSTNAGNNTSVPPAFVAAAAAAATIEQAKAGVNGTATPLPPSASNNASRSGNTAVIRSGGPVTAPQTMTRAEGTKYQKKAENDRLNGNRVSLITQPV